MSNVTPPLETKSPLYSGNEGTIVYIISVFLASCIDNAHPLWADQPLQDVGGSVAIAGMFVWIFNAGRKAKFWLAFEEIYRALLNAATLATKDWISEHITHRTTTT